MRFNIAISSVFSCFILSIGKDGNLSSHLVQGRDCELANQSDNEQEKCGEGAEEEILQLSQADAVPRPLVERRGADLESSAEFRGPFCKESLQGQTLGSGAVRLVYSWRIRR